MEFTMRRAANGWIIDAFKDSKSEKFVAHTAKDALDLIRRKIGNEGGRTPDDILLSLVAKEEK